MEGLMFKRISMICGLFFFGGLHNSDAFAKHSNATQELEAINQSCQYQQAPIEQVVLGNFANIVQNFFNIVQNPHNPVNVGANISQMLAGVVNVAVELVKGLPADMDPESRALIMQDLEKSFRASLRAIVTIRDNQLANL
jgi:hypothetical protein